MTVKSAYSDALSSFRVTLGELRDELVSFTEERTQRHERLMKLLGGVPNAQDSATAMTTVRNPSSSDRSMITLMHFGRG